MLPDQPVRFVFLDVEATGLDHDRHEMTEVAWIVRHEDGREEERQFFPFHTTDGADTDALALTRYEERIAPRRRTPMSEWLPLFLRDANQAVIVGAVPDFDVRHIEKACRKVGLAPTWDHHLLDVETLALPLISTGPERPRSLAKTCEALGVQFDRDQAHGALYDARLAKAAFDRVWELLAALGNEVEPMADTVQEVSPPPPPLVDTEPEPIFTTATETPAPEPTASDEQASDPASAAADPSDFEPPRGEPDDAAFPEPEAPQIGSFTDEPLEPIPARQPEQEPIPALAAPPEPEPPPEREPAPVAAHEGSPEPTPEPTPEPAVAAFDEPQAPLPADGDPADDDLADDEDVPFPRRQTSTLVEEAVTVLPSEGVEESLFGSQPRKVGHPQFRDPDED